MCLDSYMYMYVVVNKSHPERNAPCVSSTPDHHMDIMAVWPLVVLQFTSKVGKVLTLFSLLITVVGIPTMVNKQIRRMVMVSLGPLFVHYYSARSRDTCHSPCRDNINGDNIALY